ncbi:MAG: glutathione S-transferase family protein [Proteobacteria bacterium]|nr:glutathione S-transferase family protein [Pseudomonadota bacterium]
MSALTLIIGNRNYSSWSLRPWALLTHLGLPFDEILIELDTPTFATQIRQHSPNGKVPALRDGDLVVCESIAIMEYACELAGGRGWPAERPIRAEARSVASEMHAGFSTLRQSCPMNIRARGRRVASSPALAADIARIDAVWSSCRERHAARGPWLFGEYSAADAMYLPVAFRFQSYGADGLGTLAREYMATALADPVIAPWVKAAEAETQRLPSEETGATP